MSSLVYFGVPAVCFIAMLGLLILSVLGGREYDQGFDAEVREFPTEYRTTHGRTLTVFDGEAS